jgi:hypothetical protein
MDPRPKIKDAGPAVSIAPAADPLATRSIVCAIELCLAIRWTVRKSDQKIKYDNHFGAMCATKTEKLTMATESRTTTPDTHKSPHPLQRPRLSVGSSRAHGRRVWFNHTPSVTPSQPPFRKNQPGPGARLSVCRARLQTPGWLLAEERPWDSRELLRSIKTPWRVG